MKSDAAQTWPPKLTSEGVRRAFAGARGVLVARAPWLWTPGGAMWGAWAATRVLLFVGMVLNRGYCDPAFYHYAGLFATGHWPYRDFNVEYPPLAMALILIPAVPLLFFPGLAPRPVPAFLAPHVASLPRPPDLGRYSAYGISFGVEMLIADAATLWLVIRVSKVLWGRDALVLRAALAYIALVFLAGALLQKFDLVTGTFCLAAVYSLATRRPTLAGGVLALAALIKGFPVLALPVFLLLLVGHDGLRSFRGAMRAAGWRRAWRCFAAFVAIIGVATLAVVVGVATGAGLSRGVDAVWHTVTYHAGRAFEIESVWAGVMLAVGWLPGLRPRTQFNGQDLSRVVRSPLEGPMSLVATLALLLAVAFVYFMAWRASATWRGKALSGSAGIAAVGRATVAVMLAFMVTFRALPTHYLLVVAPLGVVMASGVGVSSRRTSGLWLASICAVAVLGQFVALMPVWDTLKLLRPWAIVVLLLRNCAWVVAFLAAALSISRGESGGEVGVGRGDISGA